MDHNGQPLVSIVIPTYNYGAHIAEAIESCLRQTYANLEIIVVDDGSTDNTAEVVAALSTAHPGRIRYLNQDNAGAAVARNRGMVEARGAFVTFLDSDDLLTPDAIEVRLRVLQENPDIGVVLTEKYNRYGDRLEYKPRHRKHIVSDRLYELMLTSGMSSAVTTSLVRIELARRFRFPENIRTGQDTAYLAKLLFHAKACILAQPTLECRYHEGSLRQRYQPGDTHPRLALISAIFDDPLYGGALEPWRGRFSSTIYLFIYKELYKAGRFEEARRYYLKLLAADPLRNLIELKALLRFLRLSVTLFLRRIRGRPAAT